MNLHPVESVGFQCSDQVCQSALRGLHPSRVGKDRQSLCFFDPVDGFRRCRQFARNISRPAVCQPLVERFFRGRHNTFSHQDARNVWPPDGISARKGADFIIGDVDAGRLQTFDDFGIAAMPAFPEARKPFVQPGVLVIEEVAEHV